MTYQDIIAYANEGHHVRFLAPDSEDAFPKGINTTSATFMVGNDGLIIIMEGQEAMPSTIDELTKYTEATTTHGWAASII